jgi:hypothetical protein
MRTPSIVASACVALAVASCAEPAGSGPSVSRPASPPSQVTSAFPAFDRSEALSGGQASDSGWEDLAYAVDLLRERGASRVVVGGASLGAMESMYALSQGLDADGLIWLSGVDLYAGVP